MPKLAQRLAAFKSLAELIGRHRVIWRFDPIIISNALTVDIVLKRIRNIAEVLSPYTEKFVFSYVDWYRKTEKSLAKIDNSLCPPTQEEILLLASGISTISAGLHLQPATCAEPIDLTTYGIAKNKCVDDKLIARLCPGDPEIQSLYAPKNVQTSLIPLPDAIKKDTGQRTPCGCVPSKDIGSYNTCMHLCAYCYANQSSKTVISKMNTLASTSELL